MASTSWLSLIGPFAVADLLHTPACTVFLALLFSLIGTSPAGMWEESPARRYAEYSASRAHGPFRTAGTRQAARLGPHPVGVETRRS